jgi:1,4-dihydroxy-2-naphthoate octaprenyltransferase
MIGAGGIPPGQALLAVLASLCTILGIAGLAYFLNDLGDVAKDALAGKPNLVAGMGRAERSFLFVFFSAAALLPWLRLPFDRWSAALLLGELGLFGLYCFRPFRLKERGALGVLTDALYAHVLPALLAVHTFDLMAARPSADVPAFLVALGCWQLALGVRNIVLHQLQDRESDLLSGTRTVATQIGPERLTAWLTRVIVPLEIVGFGAFTCVAARSLPVLAAAYPSFLLLTFARRRMLGEPMLPPTARARLYAYLDDFYVDWLPLAVLASLLWVSPAHWPLAGIHLVLFRSGLRQLGQDLVGRHAG